MRMNGRKDVMRYRNTNRLRRHDTCFATYGYYVR
jgi:hypothetical protein